MDKFFANLRNLVIWLVNANIITAKTSGPLFYWLNAKSGEFSYWLGE